MLRREGADAIVAAYLGGGIDGAGAAAAEAAAVDVDPSEMVGELRRLGLLRGEELLPTEEIGPALRRHWDTLLET